MSKRCAKCKEQVVEGSNFCYKCGASFKKPVKAKLAYRPFLFLWRKKLPIAVVLIFLMSVLSLAVVSMGYSRQRDMVKAEVADFFSENRSQLKGEKGDTGSTGMPGRNGVGGSLYCSSSSSYYTGSTSTWCY